MSDGTDGSHSPVQGAIKGSCFGHLLPSFTQVLSLVDLGQVFSLCYLPSAAGYSSLKKSYRHTQKCVSLTCWECLMPS